MERFFDLESPLWRGISRATDVVLLGMLWLLFSIPIVTMGASTTAAFYVTLKWRRNEEGYLFRSFVKSFKENFKQSTIAWLIILALEAFFYIDIYLYSLMGPQWTTIVKYAFMVMMVIVLALWIYLFPMISRFSNTLPNFFRYSIGMVTKNLGWTLLLLAEVAGCAFLVYIFNIPVWIFIFGVYAYVASYTINHIFKPYEEMIKKDREEKAMAEAAANQKAVSTTGENTTEVSTTEVSITEENVTGENAAEKNISEENTVE